MWISKKELKALRQENDAQYQRINILESQIVGQKYTIRVLKHTLYVCKIGKRQAVANFHNVREHNIELQERIEYLERYTKGLEDLL